LLIATAHDIAHLSSPRLADMSLRLAAACVLGGAIGLEREIRDREAGFRTHLIVSLGAALFTEISAYGFRSFIGVSPDPTRIAAQIVSGIGFLGAGAIIHHGSSVRGLTTAATLWVVAAIGMASGAGFYAPAAIATGFTLIALWPLRTLAHQAVRHGRPENRQLTLEVARGAPLSFLPALLEQASHLEMSEERGRRIVRLQLPNISADILSELTRRQDIVAIDWSGGPDAARL
jgi:putative Mg2+ transporter-C (MgtC) family protein